MKYFGLTYRKNSSKEYDLVAEEIRSPQPPNYLVYSPQHLLVLDEDQLKRFVVQTQKLLVPLKDEQKA